MSEATRSSVLFFASGVLASAGVNLLTSLAGAQNLKPQVIALWASQWLLSSGALSIAASYLDSGSRAAERADRPELSLQERNALKQQVLRPYATKAFGWTCVAGVFFAAAVALIFLVPAGNAIAEPPKATATGLDSSRKRVVVIHGTFGSPNENWFPWIAAELRTRGVQVDVPTFPTPEGQSLSSWRKAFAEQVGSPTPNMVLIGHSLGPAFILRLLEESSGPVAGTFLVAPFMDALADEKFNVLNGTFVNGPVGWNTVRRNAGYVQIYGSDNDPYVSPSLTDNVAKHLDAPITRVFGGGHFNTESGFEKFAQLLQDVLAFVESGQRNVRS